MFLLNPFKSIDCMLAGSMMYVARFRFDIYPVIMVIYSFSPALLGFFPATCGEGNQVLIRRNVIQNYTKSKRNSFLNISELRPTKH